VKKLLLASVFAVLALPREPLPSLSAEAFDWDRYCSDDYGCDDRGDRGVGKFFEPPSQAELRACTKSGKLDYACLRDSYWGKLTDYKICFREEGGKLDGDWPQCDPSILGAVERQCVQENFGPNRTLGFKEQWAKYYRCVEQAKPSRKPTAIEQQCVEAEGQDGKAIETAEQRANYNRCIEAHAVEIPKQYRGAWCETKWQTIYKRCSDADFEVKRTYWTTVESTCNVLSVRKSKYGGHRLLAICEGDEGSRDMPNRVEVRWWLGTNNTRLQTIRGYEPP
jgi:hypothetical protein